VPTLVELVDARTADGLTLHGALAVPANAPERGSRPFDAVLMMHGHAGTFSDPFFRTFSDALVERGYATLRADNRGHDIVNRADRSGRMLGVALESVDDCVHDWRAWIDVLAERGFRRVLVWGHSLGAVKTAFYLSHETDARVGACILASPPRFDPATYRMSERAADYAANLAQARALIDDGTPGLLFRTTFPMPALAGPQAYLDKYDAGSRYDLFSFVADVRVPILAFTGERELAEFSFASHPSAYATMLERKPDIDHLIVPGGDHYSTGMQGWVIEQIDAWLSRQPILAAT
jgi:pimeloyl-ACP methyl ester carboxylesterase